MKIDYISDLHLDFWINPKAMSNHDRLKFLIQEFSEIILPPVLGDVLVIAGDLGHYFTEDSMFLSLMKRDYYKDVFVVPGNHDRYLVSGKQQQKYKTSNNRIREMQSFCSNNEIHYLDGNVVEIDGIKIGGTGMSWDESFYKKLKGEDATRQDVFELFNRTMNDAIYIKPELHSYDYPGFDPFLLFNEELHKINKIQEVDVMVTHYPPTIVYDHTCKYNVNEVSTFYQFDGVDIIDRLKPKYWIFGHNHDTYDFYVGDTNLVCNPLGYPGENTYNIIKQLEINKL